MFHIAGALVHLLLPFRPDFPGVLHFVIGSVRPEFSGPGRLTKASSSAISRRTLLDATS